MAGFECTDARRMRGFPTGATRNIDTEKWDYEGFLSPLVLHSYAAYMHKHRFTVDGNVRESDNWQLGIPLGAYMKSGWRHFMDLWFHHRGLKHLAKESIVEACNALLFNISGYLHETLKGVEKEKVHECGSCPCYKCACTPGGTGECCQP